MNCKPGDLAVIVRHHPAHPHLTGRIVEVLEAAPMRPFKLPDGKSHVAALPAHWIVKFTNPVDLGAVRGRGNALYGSCPDSALRPIRDPGEDAQDEMLRPLPADVAPAAPVTEMDYA